MEFIYGILIALLIAHLVMAGTATVVVFRDKSLRVFQIVTKVLISWVGIFIGPLFVLYVMNEHSPELIPKFAQSGLVHTLLFLPIKPPPHNLNPVDNSAGAFQDSDASDLGIEGEGSCGSD